MSAYKPAIAYRPRTLVLELLSYIVEVEAEDGAVDEQEILDTFENETTPRKTVEHTLYDLRRYGAIYRGGGGRTHRPKNLRTTDLGRAWIDAGAPIPADDDR